MVYRSYGYIIDEFGDKERRFRQPTIRTEDYEGKYDIPAWSLHRLMCLVFNSGGTRVELFEDDDAYEILIYKIEMLIKEGYFNKEYLEE